MDGRAKSIQQQKLQGTGTPQVYKRGVPSAHGGKGEIDSTTKAPGHPSGVQARGAQRTWTEGSESVHNNSPRAPLRCTSEGCPAHMDGRAKSIQQQKLQGTPQVYKRGVPSAHGRKGANQFTIIAPGQNASPITSERSLNAHFFRFPDWKSGTPQL